MGKQNTIFDAEEFPGGPLVRGLRVSTAQGMGLTYPRGHRGPPKVTIKLRLEDRIQKIYSLTTFLTIVNIWGKQDFLVLV